jgi:hypothetical protein
LNWAVSITDNCHLVLQLFSKRTSWKEQKHLEKTEDGSPVKGQVLVHEVWAPADAKSTKFAIVLHQQNNMLIHLVKLTIWHSEKRIPTFPLLTQHTCWSWNQFSHGSPPSFEHVHLRVLICNLIPQQ